MNIMDGGAGGGGGSDTPPPSNDTPPPSGDTFTPPEWAKGLSVDQEILKAPMFQSVKTVDDIVKGYYHAQKMVGADKVVVPTKNSSADEWKAFYQKAGLPATLDEYKPTLPSSFDNEEFNKSLAQAAFEMNIKPDQLSKVAELFDKMNGDIVSKYEQEQQEALKSTAAELKKEWGQGFEKQIARANRVVKHFGGEEMHKAVLESDLANNGQFLRLMAKIGEKMLNEDTFMADSVSTFGMTKAEAQSKLNAIMGDVKGPYYNSSHAQHKEYVDKVLKFHEILAEQ